MRKVTRDELLDYVTYTQIRQKTRAAILATKRARRIHVGRHLVFLFENHETIRYQIQEMMRVERIVKEADVQHELRTYNEVLGGPGALGCTLMIEIDDEEARAEKLTRWLGLNPHFYVEVEDGARVAPTWDPRQVGTDRLSSVQYLTFDVNGRAPVAVGCSFDDPEVGIHQPLTEEQRAALCADLADD
jgi:hypothetical protein